MFRTTNIFSKNYQKKEVEVPFDTKVIFLSRIKDSSMINAIFYKTLWVQDNIIYIILNAFGIKKVTIYYFQKFDSYVLYFY
jgi:hypothetical protein